MANKYQQRALERERKQRVRKERDREDWEAHVAQVIDTYLTAYKEANGTRCQLTFRKGWYRIARPDKSYDAYRETEILKMAEVLKARVHERNNPAPTEKDN